MDFTFNKDFKYKHDNPYHSRLAEFQDIVLRDDEGEKLKTAWNQHIFAREAPLWLEIGTGYGHFMMDFCQRYPQFNFVGLDYRFKRSYTLAKKLNSHPSKNFRYLRARGERTHHLFGENELDGIFYFFPDPWPKTRHNKKRLFKKEFLEAAYSSLKSKGKIYIKTDHDEYFSWMQKVITDQPWFECTFQSRDIWNETTLANNFLTSFQTKFEKIFLAKGTTIKAMILESKKIDPSDKGAYVL